MWTDRFCPECGLKMAEIRTAGGGIEQSRIACRNFHSWFRFFDGQKEVMERCRTDTETGRE
jgi:hypothetical protein